MRGLVCFLLLLCLSCTPTRPAGQLNSDITGVRGGYSAQLVVSDHVHHVILAHVIVAEHQGERFQSLVFSQVRDGVHALRINSIWRDGTETRLSRYDRRTHICVNGNCRARVMGYLPLIQSQMSIARQTGISGDLFGPSGPIAVHVPATLFLEAEAQFTSF
jgi:hypothetical protein